ncbi:MAG: hypothetical protein FWD87_10880 [Spirochaetaceae bacterium]|nr:hypothetical protein [Spirochaetaceae bacterium]
MARIRTIKPEFFKHEDLQDLETAHPGQYIMLVYAGLWTQCDKNGVFLCKARVLKNEILPYLNFDMQKTLDILEKHGYFIKYQSGDRFYGYIINFGKYQYPSANEKNSPAKYPEPSKEIIEHSQAHFETCLSTSQDMPETDTELEGIQDNRINGLQDKGVADSFFDPPEQTQSVKDATELSTLLLTSHQKEIPDYLSGKNCQAIIERWAEDIEKLIRIDQKSPETIRQVILWVKTPGNFWFPNIQSGKKLRDKYEQLYSQMKARGDPAKKHRIAADEIKGDDWQKYRREA